MLNKRPILNNLLAGKVSLRFTQESKIFQVLKWKYGPRLPYVLVGKGAIDCIVRYGLYSKSSKVGSVCLHWVK